MFGHLLTSDNYDDDDNKAQFEWVFSHALRLAQVTGGRNGYGAKLTNIFSTKFAPCQEIGG